MDVDTSFLTFNLKKDFDKMVNKLRLCHQGLRWKGNNSYLIEAKKFENEYKLITSHDYKLFLHNFGYFRMNNWMIMIMIVRFW